MKSVEDFLRKCIAVSAPLPPLDVSLSGASGCILAQDVTADLSLPSRDLADGDGYAVVAADVADANAQKPAVLPVMFNVPVTAESGGSIVSGASAFVASGAPLPKGADAVVPVAQTDQGLAKVQIKQSVSAGHHVRRQESDVSQGETILHAGVRLGSRQLALLAAQGHATAVVHPAPRVVVMAVGDELLAPGRPTHPGYTYDAVSHALTSAVKDAGGNVFRVGVVSDDKRRLREVIEDQLVRADILITTGGLSYSGDDSVKEVLSDMGDVRFDAVAIWPGRQFGVGTLAPDTVVFSLPGDPVAALTAFEVFIRPALRTMAGYRHVQRQSLTAVAEQSWAGESGVEEYVPVKVLGNPADGYRAEILISGRESALSSLAGANGFAVIPAGQEKVQAGENIRCIIVDR